MNRRELVHRHFPSIDKVDSLSPFTVGNGEFAFTTDITGLQTFPHAYERGIPLGTLSQWGWHSITNDSNYNYEQVLESYRSDDKVIKYGSKHKTKAGQWLRANPHRLHLGRIGFHFSKNNNSEPRIKEIENIHQTVNLWQGIINSSFNYKGDNYKVETTVNPNDDQIAVMIKSLAIKKGEVSIAFEFPYGSLEWGKNSADWLSPEKHSTVIIKKSSNQVLFLKTLDTTKYYVSIKWDGDAEISQIKKHKYLLKVKSGEKFKFIAHFSEEPKIDDLMNAEETFSLSKKHWQKFWETGGAIDLSESTNPKAKELERRIVLSRYLTAIQCAGSLPPAETGLTCNSWYGKFHLEMHWWHGIHFVQWNKPEYFEKSLPWYRKILPVAEANAKQQGYLGARWPKMVGPLGDESPSAVGVFLIWQQPHPIYFTELLYRYYNDNDILEKYKEIVFKTADFMASYPTWDKNGKRFVLGPPLIPAQEIYKSEVTINPAFELAYWTFGLNTAQLWRERLGLERDEKWDFVLNNLSDIPNKNDYYQNSENAMNTFQDMNNRNDHPTLLGILGFLNSENIDKVMLNRTLDKVMESWNWENTWGWDYPLVAMTAVRLGRPKLAIDVLLMETQKNTYLLNGHNYQNDNLPIYLPGNGGLLTAVAMMAAGWEGSSGVEAPGFPKDGSWVVKYENLFTFP
ncbi:MAG: glycoside hydrolase family 65 [Ignavibacteriae bacterium]|nr:glycoside hydrolase family 65 [Ignavibacteriota bacterium]